MDWINHSQYLRYNSQQIEACMVQCLRQYSNKASLREVIAKGLRSPAWSQGLEKIFLVVVGLLMEMIVQLCPPSLRDETLRSNVWNTLKGGLCDKADMDQLTSSYDPHPAGRQSCHICTKFLLVRTN